MHTPIGFLYPVGGFTPTLLRQDTFNRANTTTSLGTPSDGGAAWNNYNGVQWWIQSNQAQYNGGVFSYPSVCGLDAPQANIRVYLTLNSACDQVGITVRQADNSNYFYFGNIAGIPESRIGKRVAGVNTNLVTGLPSWNSGDVVSLEATSSNTINAYINGTLVGSTSDSDLSSNVQGGMRVGSANALSQFVDAFQIWSTT